MGSTKSKSLWETVWYLLKLVPGVVVISVLVYLYVVRQWDLVTYPHAFWMMVGITIALSLLFSLLESALMTINTQEAVRQLEAKVGRLPSQHNFIEGVPSAEYIKARRNLCSEMELISEAGEYNAPIVVLNHLLTVLLGAVLPFSLSKTLPRTVSVDICSDIPWIGVDSCSMQIPGVGTESLTFFTVSLLLIIVGKIVPEKIGRRHNARIISRFRPLIEVTSAWVGWLVKPMLAIGDLFLKVFGAG